MKIVIHQKMITNLHQNMIIDINLLNQTHIKRFENEYL